MWSGQSLLTKLFPHWETSFACLNNFPVKNVFPPSIPALLSSFKTRSSAVGTKFISKVSRLFGSRCHHFYWTIWWGKITARSDLDFLHLKKVSLFQGLSFQRKIPFLKQTHIFWINCKQKKKWCKKYHSFGEITHKIKLIFFINVYSTAFKWPTMYIVYDKAQKWGGKKYVHLLNVQNWCNP